MPQLPDILSLLGDKTESVSTINAQIENISYYCDRHSYEMIKSFLVEHTNVIKNISQAQNLELKNKIKIASHLVMDQIFFKLQAGTQVHLSQVTNKGCEYAAHVVRFSMQSGEIEYGILASSTKEEERKSYILPKSGKNNNKFIHFSCFF